jgi:chromosome segregation ATPase
MKSGSTTEKAVSLAPRIAVFLVGIAAGAWTLTRKQGVRTDPDALRELRKATADLETRLIAQESATANRFTQIESRLDQHAAKLAEVPSTAQIVDAMEHLLLKTMATLDDRLTTQARSIELLKSTVSQTDSVLERILESLDSLQSDPEVPQPTEEDLLQLTM